MKSAFEESALKEHARRQEEKAKKDKDDDNKPNNKGGGNWKIIIVGIISLLTLLLPRPSVIAGKFYYWFQGVNKWAFNALAGQAHNGDAYWFGKDGVWHFFTNRLQDLPHNIGINYIKVAQ